MLRPEIEGEVAQGGFGHNGLASAAGSTLAADAGSRSIGFQFHRADVIDATRTGSASGTSMLLSLLESRELPSGRPITVIFDEARDERIDRFHRTVLIERHDSLLERSREGGGRMRRRGEHEGTMAAR